MLTKEEAIEKIEHYRGRLHSRHHDGHKEAIAECKSIIQDIIPHQAFMLANDITSMGNFTKNRSFVVRVSNMTQYAFKDDTTEKNIKLICDYFRNICGGRRLKSKDTLTKDLFVFSKDYSKILEKRKKDYDKKLQKND